MYMRSSAQSLFEVLLAVSVASVVLVSVVSLTTRSTAITASSRNQSLATRYAQEAFDWIKNERLALVSWELFLDTYTEESSPKIFCLNASPITSFSSGACMAGAGFVNSNTPFIRQISLVRENSEIVYIEIKVTWDEAVGTRRVLQATRITNWRK